jgi:hypothetical protein
MLTQIPCRSISEPQQLFPERAELLSPDPCGARFVTESLATHAEAGESGSPAGLAVSRNQIAVQMTQNRRFPGFFTKSK